VSFGETTGLIFLFRKPRSRYQIFCFPCGLHSKISVMTWRPMGLMQKCLLFPMVSLKIKWLVFFTEKIGSKHMFPDLWDTLYLYCCNTSQYKQFHRLKASRKLTVICSECKDIFKADDIVVSMYYLKRNILHFNIFGRRFGLRVPSSIHKFIKISKHWSKLRKTHTQASTQSSMTMVTWDRNVFQKY